MRKIKYIVYILILSILVSISFNFWKFLESFFILAWNIEYKFNNFDNSLSLYNKDLKLSDIRYYNKGNAFYKKWDYLNSILEYSKINSSTWELGFYKMHNLWNSYYRLWEKEKNDEKKNLLWMNSIYSYKEALDIKIQKDKDETMQNYLFVLNKIKKQEEKNKQNPNKENWEKEKSNPDKSESSWPWWKIWTNQSPWFVNFWDQKEIWLTENEAKELEKYSKELKDFQKENQNLIQNETKKPDTIQDVIGKFFWWNPQFSDMISNGTWKDW